MCPHITLRINGVDIDRAAVISEYVETTAVCSITEPEVTTELNWKFEDSQLDVLHESNSSDVDGEYEITMRFLPRIDNGRIGCLYTGNELCQVQKSATFSLKGITIKCNLKQLIGNPKVLIIIKVRHWLFIRRNTFVKLPLPTSKNNLKKQEMH